MGTGARLAWLAFALVSGEVAGFANERLASAWPWGAAALILALAVAWGWNLSHALLPLVFLFGMVASLRVESMRTASLERHWASAAAGETPVLDLPVEGTVERRQWRRRGLVVQFLSHYGPTPLKVVLPADDLAQMPAPGEVWRCRGWIARKPMRGGRFSRRMFWGRGGELVQRAAPGRMCRAKERFALWGEECARKAAIGLDWCPALAALNQAILLGRRADIPHERREIFVSAGTVHIFAISGLHVMMVAGLLNRFLALLGVSARMSGAWIVPALAAYVMLTGARPSAIRAAIMASIYLLAAVMGRKGDALSAWALAALAVYGFSPEKVHDTGCTLSFAVMLGIVAWLRWMQSFDLGAVRANAEAPEVSRSSMLANFGVTFAAWAASVPIAARVFGRFTFGGLIANLAVLQLAPLTVAFGMLGMLAGFVCEPAAILFNNLAAASTFLMTALSTLVAALPGASFEISPWTLTACIAWYVTVVGGLFLAGRRLMCRRTFWWR